MLCQNTKIRAVTKIHLYLPTPSSPCQRLTMAIETTIYSCCFQENKSVPKTFNVEIKKLYRNHDFFSQSSLHFQILLNLGFQWKRKKCFCKERVLICYGLLFLVTVWREKFCLSLPDKGCQYSVLTFVPGQSGCILRQPCPKCFLSRYFKTLEETLHYSCS